MKLVRRGDDPKGNFVGTQHRCVKCRSIIEVESVDDILSTSANAFGMVFWADVDCPGCHQRITITTAPRLIGDSETAEPLFGRRVPLHEDGYPVEEMGS